MAMETRKRSNALRTISIAMAFLMQFAAIAYGVGTINAKITELNTKVEEMAPSVQELRERLAVAEMMAAQCIADNR